MMDALTGQLEGGEPVLSETIGCWTAESEVADILGAVETAHPECQIGSYPFFRQGRVGANFVVRSTDPHELAQCVAALSAALTENGQAVTAGGI
jgi:molybdopterin-biosynthesis enzyme MoeA-like protein